MYIYVYICIYILQLTRSSVPHVYIIARACQVFQVRTSNSLAMYAWQDCPADLEPAPQRVRVRVWVTSGPTCKVEIDHTRRFVPTCMYVEGAAMHTRIADEFYLVPANLKTLHVLCVLIYNSTRVGEGRAEIFSR